MVAFHSVASISSHLFISVNFLMVFTTYLLAEVLTELAWAQLQCSSKQCLFCLHLINLNSMIQSKPLKPKIYIQKQLDQFVVGFAVSNKGFSGCTQIMHFDEWTT